jgi:hypothetical protein
MGDAEWDVILSGFVASESGTYTIRQSSPPFAIQYSLIVTRDFEVATSAPLRVAEGESSKRTQELPQDDSKQELQRLNRNRPYDVDNDGQVSPIDVLVLINSLNSVGRRNLANLHVEASGTRFYDVDNDGVVSPLDVLQVINYLNSPPSVAKGADFGVPLVPSGKDKQIADNVWSDPNQDWILSETEMAIDRLVADVASA